MSTASAIVISPVWPGDDQGYRIAVKSSLHEYCRVFDAVLFVALSEEPAPADLAPHTNVRYVHIPVVRQAKWLRFGRSLATDLPGITMQFRDRRVLKSLRTQLLSLSGDGQRHHIIFEDIPVASTLPEVMQWVPEATSAIRTHNVHAEAFEGFEGEGGVLSRRAWAVEISRISRFEQSILGRADRVWTISERDAEETQERYGVVVDGVLGISMDHLRYADVAPGSTSDIVSIGTADLRKAHGLSRFIRNTWPFVIEADRQARLLLAGRGTEAFTDPERRIEGFGFVSDDRSILGRAQIFVNPQERGSGVKLKSIVAMLAGKTLVSTSKGIEGVVGKSGEHFYVADNGEQMARIILRLISEPEESLRTAARGRNLAIHHYSHASQGASPASLIAESSASLGS